MHVCVRVFIFVQLLVLPLKKSDFVASRLCSVHISLSLLFWLILHVPLFPRFIALKY